MKLILVLAWRNLWRNRRRTLITVSSVAFAVVLAVAAVSMAFGLRARAIETAVRNETGYLQVQDVLYEDEPSIDHALEYGPELAETLAGFDADIALVVPRLRGFSLAAHEASTRAVMVSGILPEREERMNNFSARLVAGEMFSASDDFSVVAEGLARRLGVSPGDEIVLVGQGFQGVTAAGRFPVGGVVELPVPEQNEMMVFLPLETARWYFAAPERLTHLVLMTADGVDPAVLARSLRGKLDPEWHAVLTWDQLMPGLIGLLDMREAWNQVMAWVLYAVVGFGVFAVVLTMMAERRRELGVILSLGMKRRRLALVCFSETVTIAMLGVAAGVALAWPLMWLLQRFPLEFSGDMARYMLDLGLEPVIPFSTAPEIFLRQGFYVFCIAVLIGLYPVVRVFRLDFNAAARH